MSESTLATRVIAWLNMNGYRRASFDRIISIVEDANTYEQLSQMVNDHPHIFRHCTLKGGLPGLAFQDSYITLREEPEAPLQLDLPPTPPSAPKVTQADVDAEIVNETYLVLPDGRTTICQLTLKNGFTVLGSAACVHIANFDAEIGKRISREDAVNQIWPLLGFRLADKLSQEESSKN